MFIRLDSVPKMNIIPAFEKLGNIGRVGQTSRI
jgi:hypothetical protein